jgi:hypothetical protein
MHQGLGLVYQEYPDNLVDQLKAHLHDEDLLQVTVQKSDGFLV